MADEIKRKRLEKRRKMAEKRKLSRDQELFEEEKSIRSELFIKIGIIAVLSFIPIDFYVNIYPIVYNTVLNYITVQIAFLVWESLGIMFGLGLYFAGKKMARNSGVWSGVLQVDGSLIGAVGLAFALIVNPRPYTQENIIIGSLNYGFQLTSAFVLFFFSIVIGFFFVLVGTNSQKTPLKYVVIITGVLWLINIFLPMFRPSPTVDLMLFSIFSCFTWFIYILTAFCFWKIHADYEGLKPVPTAPYLIK